MELIDKAAIVAEIERLYKEWEMGNYVHEKLISFFNTLEVKEFDLDSNIRAYLTNHFNVYEDGVLQSKKSSHQLSTYDIIKVAKHFFELGLKQSSSDEFKLCESQILLEDDGGEPPYDGKQWLDLSCKEYEIPYDKFKVGDKIEIVIRKIKKGE